MKIHDVFTVLLLLSALTACTANQIYSSLQDSAQDKCKNMSESDRATCLSRVSVGYDSYKTQREKTMGAAKN
ncbi:MAG: hypothetical protein Q7R66_13510 [Undibacterium sp.]|nr:hypothetical protein [Undibacterium sp.]